MRTLNEVREALELEVVTQSGDLDRPVAGGYASDLLSCVMSRAKPQFVWVTLQSHVNVIAVASLLNLAAVIITEGQQPDAETLERAERTGVVLMITPKSTFAVVGELTALGVRDEEITNYKLQITNENKGDS